MLNEITSILANYGLAGIVILLLYKILSNEIGSLKEEIRSLKEEIRLLRALIERFIERIGRS